jgi:hypothetical protein
MINTQARAGNVQATSAKQQERAGYSSLLVLRFYATPFNAFCRYAPCCTPLRNFERQVATPRTYQANFRAITHLPCITKFCLRLACAAIDHDFAAQSLVFDETVLTVRRQGGSTRCQKSTQLAAVSAGVTIKRSHSAADEVVKNVFGCLDSPGVTTAMNQAVNGKHASNRPSFWAVLGNSPVQFLVPASRITHL